MQSLLVEKKHKSNLSEQDYKYLKQFNKINLIEVDGKNLTLEFLGQQQTAVKAKILKNMLELDRLGIAAKRPLVDYLRDDIYELRTGLNHINYRLLYFFDGLDIILITHGLKKEKEVPSNEIDYAIKIKNEYFKNKDI